MEIIDALGAVRWAYDREEKIARPLVRHADFVPVAVNAEKERVIEKVRFGMPGFKGTLITNARSENLISSPGWKGLFGKPANHCLTAVSYVVERDAKKTATYRIQRKDGKPMVVPGLVARRHYKFTSTGNEYDDLGHVQITAPSNEFVAAVHDRFVCELATKKAADAWMAPDADDKDALLELLTPAANERYEMVPIAQDVWKRRDDPKAVAPAGPAMVWGARKTARTLSDF